MFNWFKKKEKNDDDSNDKVLLKNYIHGCIEQEKMFSKYFFKNDYIDRVRKSNFIIDYFVLTDIFESSLKSFNYHKNENINKSKDMDIIYDSYTDLKSYIENGDSSEINSYLFNDDNIDKYESMKKLYGQKIILVEKMRKMLIMINDFLNHQYCSFVLNEINKEYPGFERWNATELCDIREWGGQTELRCSETKIYYKDFKFLSEIGLLSESKLYFISDIKYLCKIILESEMCFPESMKNVVKTFQEKNTKYYDELIDVNKQIEENEKIMAIIISNIQNLKTVYEINNI